MSGSKSHETGLRLIFVHGAGEHSETWDAQTTFFAHSEAVTLPGHRANEYLENEGRDSIEDYARWLHDYIRAEHNVDKEKRKAILVGNSMGGAIVMMYALMFGDEYLAGLGLVVTGSKMRVSPKIMDGIRNDYPALVEMLINMSFTEHATEEMRSKTRAMKMTIQPEIAFGDFVACSKFDISDELDKLPEIPTLVIGASADQMMPVKLSQSLADNIAGAKLAVIEGAGHAVQVEKPHEFNKVLDNFIASIV